MIIICFVSFRRRLHCFLQPEKAALRLLRFSSTIIPTVTSLITWIGCPAIRLKSVCIMT